MAAGDRPSRFSSAFLGVMAQASAFLAAPFLTAGIGLSISHIAGAGIGVTLAAPVLAGIFAVGAVFAGAAMFASYQSNQQRQYEQNCKIEHSVEQALVVHQPDLSMGQTVAPQRKKTWTKYVADQRESAVSEVSH